MRWFVLFALVLFSATAYAEILRVPSQYATPQEAVDASNDGDEIVLAPGNYGEGVGLVGDNVVVRSENPEDWSCVRQTVLYMDGDFAVIAMDQFNTSATVIRGLTITRREFKPNAQFSVGITGRGSKATIENCIVSNHSVGIDLAAAFYDCDGIIRNCIVENNQGNAGVAFRECDGIIENNLIRFNRAVPKSNMNPFDPQIGSGRRAVMLFCRGEFRNNTVVDNYRQQVVDGEFTPSGWGQCTAKITNSIFYHTTMTAPIEHDNSTTPTHCLFRNPMPGEGNVIGDPKFIDPAAGDYRLQHDSPAIDAGKAQSGLKADFSGVQRGLIAAPTLRGDGSGVDIGAFEALPKPVAVWLPNGGPDVIHDAGPLEVVWEMDLDTAGTAIRLELYRGTQRLGDLGDHWTASGKGVQVVTLPVTYSADDYTVRGSSLWNQSLLSNTGEFNLIGSGTSAADAWLNYE